MQPNVPTGFEKPGRLGELSRRPLFRAGIVLALTLLYILAFPYITRLAGPVGAALIAVPVAAAGWYFGTWAGLLAGLPGILLSTTLLAYYGLDGHDWMTWLVEGWPGNIMVMLTGYFAGLVRQGFNRQAAIMDDLRTRERYLTLVNMTTSDVLTSRRVEDKYAFLLDHLVNLFAADFGYFVRWDAFRKHGLLEAATMPLGKWSASSLMEKQEMLIPERALETGQVQVVEEAAGTPDFALPEVFQEEGKRTHSALVIPLIMGERKLGAVVIAYNSPHRFTAREMEYADFAADQFSLAVWTIWQETEIQRQLKETNALVSIERLLTESERVGLEKILQLIVDSAKELIAGTENGVLHMLDSEKQILQPRAVTGSRTTPRVPLNMHPGQGIAGAVIASGQMISVEDTQTDEHFLHGGKPVRFRSLIVAPILSNERALGTISIQSSKPHAFTPEDGQLLDALGKKAAVAIENANLLETTRQDLVEMNALYHISQSLAGSLDPGQLMSDVVDLLQKNFNYYHVQTFVIDRETGDLVAQHGSGKIGNSLFEEGFRIPVGGGIIGHVAEMGEPFLTNNVEAVIFFRRNELLSETQSELAVPILVDGRVVGVLDVQQAPPKRFTERDLKMMKSMTEQLAVVLQKANLYSELQNSLKQEQATRDQLMQSERLAVAGRLLASVSHELNNPLQVIQNALFLLREEETLSDQGRQDMDLILAETERMTFLLDRLRATYRPVHAEDMQEAQLNSIIEDVCVLTATHMRHKQVKVEFKPGSGLPPVSCVPDQLRQVVLNLVMNAVEAMESGGCLSIETQHLPDQEMNLITVTDTGPGIDPDILPHIFEPFTTNKQTGTGLGLSITHDIIHQYKGEIEAVNNPGGGATFKVWLPVGGGE